MTLAELMPFINLVLVPIFIYVVKLERKLAIFETKGVAIERQLQAVDKDLKAVHARMDRFGLPHASAEHGSR